MAYTATVNPTTDSPTGHATLFDGDVKANIIFFDPNKKIAIDKFDEDTGQTKTEYVYGGPEKLAIKRFPIVDSALKTYEGDLTYDSENPPYFIAAQNDTSGGRGQEDFERDKTRYYDAWNIDTINGEDGFILNGLPTYSTGFHNVQEDSWSGNVTWRGLYDTTLYISESFSANANYAFNTTTGYGWLKIRKVGSPTSSLYYKIYSNSSSKPSSSLVASAAIPYTSVTDTLSVVLEFALATGTALVSGTTYHVVVYASANGTATDHWEVACDSTSTTSCISANGSSWTVTTGYAPHFRFFLTTDKPFKAHFIDYKGGLYLATEPDDGSVGGLYLNGWRGACDSNSGDLTYLNDATAPGWAADELIHSVIRMTEGDAARKPHAYREITDNTTTAVECSPDWDEAHTVYDAYVINACNKWTKVTSTYLGSDIFTQPICNVKVANGIMYLANLEDSTRAEKVGMAKFHEYNGAGTWTREFGPTGIEAQHLEVVHDETLGPILWLGRINYQDEFFSDLIRAVAPQKWSTNELVSGTVLEDCGMTDGGWNECDPVSGVTCKYYYGWSIGFDLTGVFATGIIGSEAIPSTDIRPFNKINFKIKSSVDISANVLQICLDNTAKCVSPVITANIPALKAGVWQTCDLTISPSGVDGAEAIVSIGLNCTADQDKTFQLYIGGPVRAYSDYAPVVIDGRLTGLQKYGSPELIYVLQEDEIGYIDNGLYIPLEIPGMSPLASPDNGMAHEDFNGYLAYSFHKGVMLYYGTTQKYIGPDVDAGMPYNRTGTVVKLIATADKLYIAYDGGVNNYSSVLCYHGNGWHEVYRSPIAGRRIRNIHIQSIPGRETQRLWISEGCDVLWVPISRNPFEIVKNSTEYDMRFVWEGALETSYIYTGRRELQKLFNSLKVWVENVSAGNYYVEADYKLDGATSWTAISGDFDTVPVEEIVLSASSPPTSKGKRIRLRIRLITNDNTKTPRVKTIALSMVAFSKVKFGYQFYCRLADGHKNMDIQGNPDTTFANTEAFFDKLDYWANNSIPLTLDCVYAPYHNKTVIINPMQSAPIALDLNNVAGEGREVHLGYIQCIEA